ncbi:MBL fold metallo-hydrolase [uncultured Cohaesibacter sp.]|uniref:MBL fold metallo-hydrolase n=1 Tax=uncultured Cohaesibacter sp. TaxID=1002546 RepID=UPI0029C7E415|nr:MBL fold metallo-hydrolase [uncultured Cohaesibacter sp.]
MTLSRRQLLSGAAGAAMAATALSHSRIATAKGTQASGPLPGVVRRRIGDIQVTALLDGYMEMPAGLFSAPKAEAERLKKLAFKSSQPNLSPVNAFLLTVGDRLILIDSGAANSFGPTLGRLPQALAANGIGVEQIDAVLLTHMHPDHIAGTIDASGQAVFPNAEMILPEADFRYWHDDGAMAGAPNAFKPFFSGARQAVKAYRGRTTQISGEKEVMAGVRALPLHGHTPGHTGYLVTSGDEALFIWADIIHNATFQLAHPEWGPTFDVDPAQAAKTRQRALDMAAADELMVAGMHLPFPAVGYIEARTEGFGYMTADWPYHL